MNNIYLCTENKKYFKICLIDNIIKTPLLNKIYGDNAKVNVAKIDFLDFQNIKKYKNSIDFDIEFQEIGKIQSYTINKHGLILKRFIFNNKKYYQITLDFESEKYNECQKVIIDYVKSLV